MLRGSRQLVTEDLLYDVVIYVADLSRTCQQHSGEVSDKLATCYEEAIYTGKLV